jgi:hypothetical protein
MLVRDSRFEAVEEFNYCGSVLTSKIDEHIQVQRCIVANKAYISLLNVMKLNCINRNVNK